MSFDLLSNQLIRELALSLPLQNISYFCQISKKFNNEWNRNLLVSWALTWNSHLLFDHIRSLAPLNYQWDLN